MLCMISSSREFGIVFFNKKYCDSELFEQLLFAADIHSVKFLLYQCTFIKLISCKHMDVCFGG
jgi:hypothetical protein